MADTASGRDDGGRNVVAEQVRQGTQQVAEQTTQAVGQVADQARQQAQTMLDQRKSSLGQSLHGIAEALENTEETLRQQQEGVAATALDVVAQRLDGVATYLDQHTASDLISEAENFTRRNAPVVLGGTFLLGLVAARVLKSSPPQSPQSSGGQAGRYDSGYRGSYAGYGSPRNYGAVPSGHLGTYGTGIAPGNDAGFRNDAVTPVEVTELEPGLGLDDGTTI